MNRMNLAKERLAHDYAKLMDYEVVDSKTYITSKRTTLTVRDIVKVMDEWKFIKRGKKEGDEPWSLDMERIERVNHRYFSGESNNGAGK